MALVMLMNIKFQGIVYVFLFAILGAFVVVKKPYMFNYNTFRFTANMIITVAVEAIYVYYSVLDPENKNKSKISNYLPLIVCVLLIICVLYNAGFIIYNLAQAFIKFKS